jgi:choline dehydrogenase
MVVIISPSDLLQNAHQHAISSSKQQHADADAISTFDFVIVGAGSAGCVVAARLAEDENVNVLLMEAGTRVTEWNAKVPLACGKLQQTQRDWALKTESSSPRTVFQGMRNQQFLYPRGKCLGGSSILNYMAYVRGCAKDYDTWETDFGATGWAWRHVLPLFIQSEHNENLVINNNDVDTLVLDGAVHGTNGPLAVSCNPTPGGLPQAFVRAGQELGFVVGDYNNGVNENVVSLFQQTIDAKGGRCDSATAYIFNQLSSRRCSNLTILTNAQATRLLFDDHDAKTVVGVEVVDVSVLEGGNAVVENHHTTTKFQVHARKEVILSAGAIGSPQLLLLSGIGPAAELEAWNIDVKHDLRDVGKHLEEHPAFPFLFAARRDHDIGATNATRTESMPRALLPLLKWLIFGKGMLATSAYDATLFYKTDAFAKTHSTYGPNAQIGFFTSPGDARLWQTNAGIAPAHDFAKVLYNQPDPQGVVLAPTLLHSYSRGSVTLATGSNPLAKPNVTLNLLDDERDMQAMVALMRKCLELAQTCALKNFIAGPVFPPAMLAKHGCALSADDIYGDSNEGDIVVSDDFLMDFIRHYTMPLYHPTSTCKIGKVVDPQLHVLGIKVCAWRMLPSFQPTLAAIPMRRASWWEKWQLN